MQDTDTELLLLRVSSYVDDQSWILHVHSYHTHDSNVIFLPQRCYDQLKHQPSDVEVEVLEEEETPPLATKIVLQPIDNSTEGIDIAKAVSEYLSSWHTISVGTLLHVPVEEFGGYIVDITVAKIEPETHNGYVLLRGEVPLELEEPLIKPEVPLAQPPTHIPRLMPTESNEDNCDCEWSGILPQQTGNQVVSTTQKPSKSKGYVPFGGIGRRLCDP